MPRKNMPTPLLAVAGAGVTLVAGALAVVASYLLALSAAAARMARGGPPPGPGRRRFAVLVPAHNEELLIGRLLGSLAALDYPAHLVDVHVVADNCDDATASTAHRLGACVHERTDPERRGKGHALRWLLERVRSAGRDYDAYVVLDADSVVSPNLLRAMDARLESGSLVVQAYYSVFNARASSVAALRYAALAAVHFVRPLGRAALGLSCGLKGNGMCFQAGVLERYSWEWFTLAEDVEFHLVLVQDGIRVDFAPEATVLAEMPVTLEQAASQNARWERGRLALVRSHVPRLLATGVMERSPLRLDAAVEQLIPPVSVPFALSGICLAGAVLLRLAPAAVLAAVGAGGFVLHLFSGLALVRAPLSAYAALGYAPVYIVWKAGVYARAAVGGGHRPWVRTARLAGSPNPEHPVTTRL
jgi:cellulose synthase/poly-beta-1,6-N-acetylglucosamine synthase-like glycosyltransferase